MIGKKKALIFLICIFSIIINIAIIVGFYKVNEGINIVETINKSPFKIIIIIICIVILSCKFVLISSIIKSNKQKR